MGQHMIFKVECEVESTTPLDKELEINCGDKTVVLKPKNNILSFIIIKKRVTNIESFKSGTSKDEQGKFSINVGYAKEVRDEFINDFQELESILPLDYGVKKIYWGEFPHKGAKIHIEPENEEERKLSKVLYHQIKPFYPDNERPIDSNHVKYIFENKHKLRELIVSLAFFREGLNDYHEFRYAHSFCNFYFIIEDLYANGKSDENGFINECGKSSELLNFVKRAYDELEPEHKQKIKSLLDERHFSEEPLKLLTLIFRIRGELHHFGSKSTQKHGTPFNQEEFESHACFISSIVYPALLQKISQKLQTAEGSIR
jgi:hypothetical protein